MKNTFSNKAIYIITKFESIKISKIEILHIYISIIILFIFISVIILYMCYYHVFKNYQNYKSIVNVNFHVTISFNHCCYCYYDMSSFLNPCYDDIWQITSQTMSKGIDLLHGTLV